MYIERYNMLIKVDAVTANGYAANGCIYPKESLCKVIECDNFLASVRDDGIVVFGVLFSKSYIQSVKKRVGKRYKSDTILNLFEGKYSAGTMRKVMKIAKTKYPHLFV